MTTITIHKPIAIRTPRGAPVAANLFLRFIEACERTLSSYKQSAKANGRQSEAAKLRRYADSLRMADPRFAADLFAAADRHELNG